VFVHTLEPGIAGIALRRSQVMCQPWGGRRAHQDATGLGERSTSTRHIRQLPAIARLR
jgi:hypothetical protein